MSLTIIGLAALFFLGHALKWFFIKTKIPDLLILVILGYVIGPQLGWINAADLGQVGGVLSTLALVVILYEGGIHLNARDLVVSSLPASLMSLSGFFLIVVASSAFLLFVSPLPPLMCVLVGFGIGSTSSAIVIPLVKHLSIQDKTKTILSLESAFTDVLAIVGFIILLDAIESQSFDVLTAFSKLGPGSLIAVIWGLLAALLWASLRKADAPFTEVTFASEAYALLIYGLLELSGYNGALGVLALGFMLANIGLLPDWALKKLDEKPVTTGEVSLLAELTFLLKTFFFVYLGILIQFNNLNIILIALCISALIFLTRYISVRMILRPKDYSRIDAMVSVGMGPRGLACAVLATLPAQRGLPDGAYIQDLIFTVVPLTIYFTAIFVALSEKKFIRLLVNRTFGAYMEHEEFQSKMQLVEAPAPQVASDSSDKEPS
jgi:cell volume regulation protein A